MNNTYATSEDKLLEPTRRRRAHNNNKKNVKNVKKYKRNTERTKFTLALIPIYILFTTFAIEVLTRLNILEAFAFIGTKPLAFLLNLVLVTGIFIFFICIFNKKYVALPIITILMTILGIAAKIKFEFRGTGPAPADLVTLGEAGEMAGALTGSLIIAIVLYTLAILFISALIIKKMYFPKLSSKGRLKGIVGFLLFFFFIYSFSPDWIVVRNESVKRKATVIESGAPFYFFSQFNNPLKIKIPKESEIIATFGDELNEISYDSSQLKEKPDIILIQSESFFDPTETMEAIDFSEDPLPFFHELQKKSDSFKATSPVYGGGTANAEFEVMTGLSTVFFPTDMTIYLGYLNKPTISLGSILREQGYYSFMQHPFWGNFYKRNEAYNLLGFNRFDSIESMDKNDSEFKSRGYTFPTAGFISDRELTNQIIQGLEENTQSPNFIFAVSVQTHVPYQMYPEYDITYTGDGITDPEHLEQYNAYLKNLKSTDDGLKNLIEYLEKRKKPTIVAFYGDHQPSLKFRNSLSKKEMENFQASREVPAFIWSNYEKLETTDEVIDMTSMSEKILTTAKLDMPNYLYLLKDFREQEKINAFTNFYVLKDNQYYAKDTPEYEAIYSKYNLITGDILNKNKYIEEDPNKWFVKNNEDYIGPMLE